MKIGPSEYRVLCPLGDLNMAEETIYWKSATGRTKSFLDIPEYGYKLTFSRDSPGRGLLDSTTYFPFHKYLIETKWQLSYNKTHALF
jgi:hypothetical protein